MRIREARPEDAERLERLRVRSWRAAYPGLVEQHVLDDLEEASPVEVAVWKRLIENVAFRVAIAENEGGDTVGFCAVAGPSRDADEPPGVAEIAALYVDPRHYGLGIGRTLMDTVLAALRESDQGWRECTVWTLERNERALALYHSLGFREDGASRTDEFWHHPDLRLRLAL